MGFLAFSRSIGYDAVLGLYTSSICAWCGKHQPLQKLHGDGIAASVKIDIHVMPHQPTLLSNDDNISGHLIGVNLIYTSYIYMLHDHDIISHQLSR